jgi:UMF1 family MFS transporter
MALIETVDSPSTKREKRAWYWYDWANSAFYTTVVTTFLGPYLGSIARRAAGCDTDADVTCDATVPVFGLDVAPGSLFAYTASLSVFLTVFVLPVVGAVADRSRHKKELMAGAAFLGAAATVGFLFLTGDRYLLGAGLFLAANILYGASIVVYYSFLPQISSPEERDHVSSVGWAFGYVGGGTLLALNVVAVLFKDSLGMTTGEVARWSLVSAGVWWAGFTVIPLIGLKNREPFHEVHRPGGNVLTDGFAQLWETLKSLRAYPLTLMFLAAYLIYNDGIQTVIAMSAVYGTDELGLDDEVLVPTILMVQFLAFFGALGLGALAKRIGAWKALLISLGLWIVVIVAAFFLPDRQVVPFVVLGGGIGLVLGGSQALSRSLFSQLIPKGREGEYFGLYEISDKGTSWLGPLLFGVAYQVTDSYRVAIFSLLIFFVGGMALLFFVPMRRAIEASGNVPPSRL